jgi:hypothetical protein
MDEFIGAHADQLQFLNIPTAFFASIYTQLVDNRRETPCTSEIGSMLVLSHLCSWDMLSEINRGLWDGLTALSLDALTRIYQALRVLDSDEFTHPETVDDKDWLLEAIYSHPRLWTCVVLYRDPKNRVRGALPAPPYYRPMVVERETDASEADLSGPFGFRYHAPNGTIVDCSLLYVDASYDGSGSPTMDYVPLYSVPNVATRSIRYAALLGQPPFAMELVKEMHANFVHSMHLVRQQQLETSKSATEAEALLPTTAFMELSIKRYKVYTDTNDPMQLGHPAAGLSKDLFELVDTIQDADIVYSYHSLFAPGPLRDELARRPDTLINQFPYEGAMVQKDHLGREILRQHGLPRPSWAIETYDLDCQVGEFLGAAVLDYERSHEWPVWIIKPASGTQSKGHVVTKSLAQVVKLMDAGGPSRVAQRYLQHPVCFQGRKVDCRCIVMMTPDALYMHKRVYFRIAAKTHSMERASDLVDHEKVLSAMHLVDENNPTADHAERMLLPIDSVTIAQLEQDYGEAGFDWKTLILPKVHTMIKELFQGMKRAYPAMGASSNSRAIYGVDVMFEVGTDGIEPKLTEVTFCPSNNAVCDAYQREEDLYRNYNTDVFKCVFLGQMADSIVQLD